MRDAAFTRNGDFRAGAPMDGLFVLIVLLLLAAPIIGIVALIRSITDRNLLRQLDARVKALEAAQVAAQRCGAGSGAARAGAGSNCCCTG